MKNKHIKLLFILIVFFNCGRYEKKYFENGQLESVVKIQNGKKIGKEIIFNEEGDTLKINHYINDTLSGKAIEFGHNLVYLYKRIYSYKRGLLNGTVEEYIDNKLRLKWYFIDGVKMGSHTVYDHVGNLKWDAFFYNDQLCYWNEYDSIGKLKNVNTTVNYSVTIDTLNSDKLNIWIDFLKENKFHENKELVYAFFKFNDNDTIKITDEIYKKKIINGDRILIPFDFKQEGNYFIKVALPAIINYEETNNIYVFSFSINQDGKIFVPRKEYQKDKIELTL